MKKFIIADIINGLYIEELEGNEKVYTNIEWFIEDLAQEATFESENVAIEYTEENVKAIEAAGYTF
jgi:hypothetical protein